MYVYVTSLVKPSLNKKKDYFQLSAQYNFDPTEKDGDFADNCIFAVHPAEIYEGF